MDKAALKVSLLESPRNPLSVIYAAYRQCYSMHSAGDIYESQNSAADIRGDFVPRMVASGHESPLEHVLFYLCH
jgi:thymidylate synthase (FAD)